jgi:flagellin
MALGVLNNLSAIYAENNLNNTNNSLQKVLQQLSSGSRINSGADDAAGLSLVNGLGANSAALTQSETNATEGVGLLQVADGALSQVTNLLNRAITLATEASNGTLNSTQESAANQEYQSILAEVNNIGQTTTYNQEQVFNGTEVAIYTGDSSMAGSSSDNLYIRSLSQSSVGDTGGKMSYSSGANSVFVNLSTNGQNAKATDTLNSNGTTTIDVNYLVKGANGTGSTASTTITVGTGTSYANTVNGLISAINNAGLGMTASFTTQAGSGVTGGGTQTGIQITGGLISAGIDPNSVSTSGVIDPSGIPASELLSQGQTVTVKVGGATVGAVTISPSVNTLAELAGAINAFAGAPVTATVITNGDGSQSLSLAAISGSGALSVSTTSGAGTLAPVFSVPTTAAPAPTLAVLPLTAVTGVAVTPPTLSAVTFGVAGTGNLSTDALSAGGSVTITNSDAASLTFIVGAGTDTATTFFTANHGDHSNTLANLATTIQAQSTALDANATVNPAGTGITVTAKTALNGENLSAVMGAVPLTNANNTIGLYNPTDGGAATTGTPTITALDAGAGTAQDDVLSTGTHITLTNALTLASTTFTAAAGQTFADLALQINASNLGVTATFNPNAGNGALILTSNTAGVNTINVSADNLKDATVAGGPTLVVKDAGFTGVQLGTAGSLGTYGTAVLQLATGNIGAGGDDIGVDLTGQIQIQNGAGTPQTFIMGVNPGGPPPAGTFYTGANTVLSLVNAINSDLALGITAIAPGLTGNPGTGGIYLQSNTTGTTITTPGVTTLASAVAMPVGTPVTGVTAVAGSDSSVTVGVLGGGLNTGDTMTGSISITNGAVTHSFSIGTGVASLTNTVLAAGTTLAQLASAITAVAALGLTAQANTTGITLTSSAPEGTAIAVNSSSLADTSQGSYSSMTLGSFASQNDAVSGSINFTLGTISPALETIDLTAGVTVMQMIDKINGTTAGGNTYPYGVTASWVAGSNGYGNVKLTSNAEGSAGQIAVPVTSVIDTTATAALSYTTANPYDIGLSNSASTAVLYDSTTGQSQATFVANTSGTSGIATIGYTDGAGQSLSSTDLLNQADAQAALNELNVAINDVASMDGYIGAQINTLNSISQVMSTQQENVISAQNAIQATDYASATSNMSKYEILSQTGIAALAQANSVEQEVTKLLQ